MRAFRWYNLVYIMLLSYLLKQTTTEDLYTQFEAIYKAVIDSYDKSMPFEENMDIILRCICPDLSAPSCAVHHQEKEAHLPVFSNTSSNKYNIAREFVKKNAHYLNGCCGKCSCENTCLGNGNCCYSKSSKNELDNSNLKQFKSSCVTANIKALMPSYFSEKFPNSNSYFMVSTCLNETVDTDAVNRCLQPNVTIKDEVIPVVSNTTKIIYLNRFCAQCNHVNNTVQWKAKITLKYQRLGFGSVVQLDSVSDILQMGLTKQADIEFIPPALLNVTYDDYGCIRDVDMVNTHCNSSGYQINTPLSGGEILERACSSIKVPFTTYLGITSPNAFCYLCNTKRAVFNKYEKCESKSNRGYATGLSGLINVRDTENEIADKDADKILAKKSNNCTCQEVFNKKQVQCRKVYCPYMEWYAGCLCIRFINDLYGFNVNAFFELRPLSNGDLPRKWKDANIDIDKVKTAVRKRFEQKGTISVKYFAVFQGRDSSGDFFYFASSISSKSGFDCLTIFADVYTRLRNGISLSIGGTAFQISIGNLFEWNLDLSSKFALSENENKFMTKRLFSVSDNMKFKTFVHSETLSPLLFCKQIILTDDESEVFTNSTDQTKNGIKRNIGDVYFWQSKDEVKICLEDYVELFQESTNNGISFHNMWEVYLLLCIMFSA